MVPANEHNPVVSFPESARDLVVNHLVIAGLIESEAAVPCDDEQGIRASVLEAQFVDDTFEITMDVAADDDCLDARETIGFHGCFFRFVLR